MTTTKKRAWSARQHVAYARKQLEGALRIMGLSKPIDARWLVRVAEAAEIVIAGGQKANARNIAEVAEHIARRDMALFMDRYRSKPKPP